MNVRSGRFAFPLAALLVLCGSCSQHHASERLRRIAILPPSILIDDPGSQWLTTALPIVWEEDLATASDLVVQAANDSSGAYQFGATEILRTTVEKWGGRAHLHGVLTDASTQRNLETFDLQSVSGENILPLANAFAKQVDKGATTFSTASEQALQIFTAALQKTNPSARIEALNNAVGVDSSFGLAYILLAETEAQSDRQALPDLLTKAGQHANSFTALDRAKFNAFASQAVHAPILQQRIALRTVLQLAPNTLDALTELGSLRFLQGDATNGETVMARALELSPGNAAVLQQLGRGLIETRQFAQAEKVLTGLDQNAAILPALATCILLEGDLTRANAVSDRFSRSLQPEVQVIYRATWRALSGDLNGAIGSVSAQHFANPNLQSAVTAELVIWHLMQTDFAAAKATLVPVVAPSGAFTPESFLISRADEPVNEWMGSVQSSSLGPEQKQSVLAYGLFLAGHYDRAAQFWQRILGRSGGTDLRARAMLAGSLERSGHSKAAAKITVQPFIPEFGDLYAAVSFQEMRRLLNLQVR